MSYDPLTYYEKKFSKLPEYYFGPIDDWMRDEGFSNGIFGIHRDSDVLEKSNYETVKQLLQGHINNEDLVRITSSSHFLVGWTESMHIKMRNRHGKFTRPFKIAVRILERLENYPVLDEEDYSRREYEDLCEWLDTEVDEPEACASWLFEVYSVCRADDVKHDWIKEWKKENEPNDD